MNKLYITLVAAIIFAALALSSPMAQTSITPPVSVDHTAQARLAVIAEKERTDELQRSVDDLRAQQSMAKSANALLQPSWAQVWIGAAGLIGLAASLAFTAWSLAQTRHALSTQRETKESETRAYLGIDKAELHNFVVGECPCVRVTIKNYGSTPAFAVAERMRVTLIPVGAEPNGTTEPMDSGVTVSPGAHTISKCELSVLTQHTFDAFKGPLPKSGVALSVVGEATYVTFGNTHTVRYGYLFYGNEGKSRCLISSENWSD